MYVQHKENTHINSKAKKQNIAGISEPLSFSPQTLLPPAKTNHFPDSDPLVCLLFKQCYMKQKNKKTKNSHCIYSFVNTSFTSILIFNWLHMVLFDSFSVLRVILLYEYTTIYLSILLFIDDHWGVSSFDCYEQCCYCEYSHIDF